MAPRRTGSSPRRCPASWLASASRVIAGRPPVPLPIASAIASAESRGARIVCSLLRPSAVLADTATRSAARAYGHGTVVLTQKSPKSQSEAATGFVPRIATT